MITPVISWKLPTDELYVKHETFQSKLSTGSINIVFWDICDRQWQKNPFLSVQKQKIYINSYIDDNL